MSESRALLPTVSRLLYVEIISDSSEGRKEFGFPLF